LLFLSPMRRLSPIFLGSVELFGFEPAVKSRRRKPVQQIVRRLKVCGFRVTAERGRQGARR
jgi:hypothetical protein